MKTFLSLILLTQAVATNAFGQDLRYPSFNYDDVERFAEAIARIEGGTDPERAFQDYLDGANAGLYGWSTRYSIPASRYADAYEKYPAFMVFSLPSLDGLGSRKVLSRDGDSIFSVSTPGRLRRGQSFVSRIDAKSREEVARVEFDSRLYRELGVSADGRWVAVTAEDEAPFILHSDDLTLKCRLTPPESTDDRRFGGAVGFSSDSRRVAISMNYSTEVWNVEACAH